jgi:hypothetical protein
MNYIFPRRRAFNAQAALRPGLIDAMGRPPQRRGD